MKFSRFLFSILFFAFIFQLVLFLPDGAALCVLNPYSQGG